MVEALLFLGELLLMGAFLFQVAKSEKTGSKKIGGLFSYKNAVDKPLDKKSGRRRGA